MIEFDVAFRPGADFAVTFGGEVPLDAEMGQVMEVLATEERTVELSMPSGNQVILPTSGKGMRKVTIQKPDTPTTREHQEGCGDRRRDRNSGGWRQLQGSDRTHGCQPYTSG